MRPIQRQREAFAYRIAASEQDAMALVDRLQGEFDQWAKGVGAWKPDRGAIGHWPHVESFMRENYPAAYRGLQYGVEEARLLLSEDPRFRNTTPYSTGPEAMAEHGYDPKEVVAGMLYLHNRSHPGRVDPGWVSMDTNRLTDIAQKRHQMQKAYDERQKVAMPTWYHLTDDPDFALDPQREPASLNGPGGPGVFLTQRPDEWAYNVEGGPWQWSGERPYIAEIDAPDDLHTLPGAWHDPDSTRPTDAMPGSDEVFVPADQYHHLTVKGVRPRTAAVDQSMLDRLHGEFTAWLPKYPEVDGKRGPIGYWPNIEKFFKARYPAAHKGLLCGLEQASQVLDGKAPMLLGHEQWDGTKYPTGPEAVAEHGYDPAEIAASFVLLHNQSHPLRGRLSDDDQARLVDIAQKRHKMQQAYEERIKNPVPPFDITNISDDHLDQMEQHDPEMADNIRREIFRQRRQKAAARSSDYIEDNFGPHYRPGQNRVVDDAANAYAVWAGRLDDSRGDHLSKQLIDTVSKAGLGDYANPYDAADALQQHLRTASSDYDDTAWWAAGWDDEDDDDDEPLHKHAVAYHAPGCACEPGTHYSRCPDNIAGADHAHDLTGRLSDEYKNWWQERSDERGETEWRTTLGGGELEAPFNQWSYIEEFLLNRYPAAHRGLRMGLEQVQPMLDGYSFMGDRPPKTQKYETGPKAVAKHGYDPAEVVAGMLYLHNDNHRFRSEMKTMDTQRIMEIAQGRSRMQWDYNERTGKPEPVIDDVLDKAAAAIRTAMPYYHNTDAELNPGDELLPASQRGHDSKWKHVTDYDPNSVYFTKEDQDDWAETDRGRNRYEIVPIGEVQQDPEHLRHIRDFEKEVGRPWDAELDADEDVMQNSYKAPRARVVRKLPPRNDQYDHPDHPDYERFNKPVQRPADHPGVQRIPIPFTAARTAMPAPLPEGVTFKYHHTNDSIPEGYSGINQGGSHTFLAPAVAAYKNDKPIAYVEWWPTDKYPNAAKHYRHVMDKGKPGEVYYIHVHPNYRRNSIASEMFRWAKDNVEPDLHHSPKKSELGKKWVSYEESTPELARAAAVIRYAQRVAMPASYWEMRTKNKGHAKGRYYYEKDRSRDGLIKKLYGPGHTYRDNPDGGGSIIGPDGQEVDQVSHHGPVF